jgi:hypothetical protein
MKAKNSPDWESLLKRLTAVALGLFGDRQCRGDEAVLPGTGVSAKDLVYGAILEFLKKEPQYRVKSDEDRFRLIVTIMKRDFFDLVKPRREHSRTVILDEEHDGGLSRKLANQQDSKEVFASADAASEAKKLYHLAEGEKELIDLIDAAAEFGHLKKEDIAYLLGVTPDQLTNMQKKLRYRSARPRDHRVVTKSGEGDNAKR